MENLHPVQANWFFSYIWFTQGNPSEKVMGRAWRWYWMAPTAKQQSQNTVQEVVWSYSTVAKISIQTHTESHLQLDSSNHPYVDKQVDTSLPTCVQAQICRGAHATCAHAQLPPHPGRCTHSLPPCTWANTQAGVLLMLTYTVSRYRKKTLRKKSTNPLIWLIRLECILPWNLRKMV